MRFGWIAIAVVLLAGFIGICWWLIPQATAVDRAVLFAQALANRQDGENYEVLGPDAASSITRDEFDAASASVRHTLAANGIGSMIVKPGGVSVSFRGAVSVEASVSGQATSIPITLEHTDPGHMYVVMSLQGLGGKVVPARIGLERDILWWRVLSLDVSGKPIFGEGVVQ